MPVDVGRRRLIGVSLGAALLAPVGRARAMLATRGSRVSVRATGARGDGRQDDTAAFQKAVDRAAAKGGVVEVPAGRYLIDPVRSIRLRSGVEVRMAGDAILLAKPNAASRAYVFLAEGIEDAGVSGGQIHGERDAHLGRTGDAHSAGASGNPCSWPPDP